MNNQQKGFIDSHFHLHSLRQRGIDTALLLDDMEEAGIKGGIDVGVDCDDLPVRTELLEGRTAFRMSAGIGPWGVGDGKPPIRDQIDRLERIIRNVPICAIGEIGLDNHWKYGTQELQETLFRSQTELANGLHLPIIVHSREADDQLMAFLKEVGVERSGILHCFQGSKELARKAVDKGFFISFAGPLTYKANAAMRDVLASLPKESILLETDSPYLSPEPLRGRTNTPLNMPRIYEAAAEVRGTTVSELAEQIRSNFAAFLASGGIA